MRLFLIPTCTALLMVLCASSCDRAPKNPVASEGPRAGWPETIRIGLIPSEGGADIVDTFAPLAKHLTEAFGQEVVLRPANEYIGVITAMRNKQVEFAYFGPKSYVEAARVAGAEPMVKELTGTGDPFYYGILVVKKDSPIQSLADAKDASFAFVTPNSTSGWLVPAIGVMEETGKRPEEYFGQIAFTGSHGSSMERVLAGDIDVAATNDLDLKAMTASGKIPNGAFDIIWKSEPIPASPIAGRSDLPQSLKDAMREAMLELNNKPEVLKQMSRGGYAPTNDEEFDVIRLLEQKREEMAEARSE